MTMMNAMPYTLTMSPFRSSSAMFMFNCMLLVLVNCYLAAHETDSARQGRCQFDIVATITYGYELLRKRVDVEHYEVVGLVKAIDVADVAANFLSVFAQMLLI